MKILSLGRIDCAAAGFFLSRAIRRHTRHEAHMVRLAGKNTLEFPADIVAPPGERMRTLWKWADVIHIHDFARPLPGRVIMAAKPVVVTYHGTAYRNKYAVHDQTCESRGWLQTVSTIDLTLLSGARWMPDTRIDLARFASERNEDFTVIHAPTNRAVKSTKPVARALRSLDGVRLDLIEGRPYEECLERKARGHVLVDQFKLGYGCNAIEAWAMGLVVIANARRPILTAMRKKWGYIPFVRSTLKALPETVLRLRDDRTFYQESLERGWQHWHDYHRPEVVAQRAVEFYEEAIETAIISQPNVAVLVYMGRNSGLQTWWGPVTRKRYEFSTSQRVGYVDVRDLVTGRSNNPGLLEMTEGRRRAFRRG